MEFESSTPEKIAAAVGFGATGFAAIAAAYVFPSIPIFVFVLGMMLMAAGLCFATWLTVVHVERRARRVTKIQRILFWTFIRRYPFSSFREIRVATSKGVGGKATPGTVHRLRLLGAPDLTLPGGYDRRTAESQALALSRLMEIPAETGMRSGTPRDGRASFGRGRRAA